MTNANSINRRHLPTGLLGDRHDRSVNLRYALVCLLLAPLALALSIAISGSLTGGALGVVAFFLMAAGAGVAFRHYPHDRLGWANIITLSRTAIIAALFAPLSLPGGLAGDTQLAWIVLVIAIFALCLDGFDGFFARRQKLVSDFGARFDMEIDSVFALLLSVLALYSGKAGAWVLVLGGLRYGFVAASFFVRWLNGPLPERFSRKVICVIQIGVLIALLAPVVAGDLSYLLAAVGTILLVYSFGRDVVWLARHRG